MNRDHGAPIPAQFIVGFPQSGTSALHQFLDQHPEPDARPVHDAKAPRFPLLNQRLLVKRGRHRGLGRSGDSKPAEA